MKKVFCMMLAAAMLLSLAACAQSAPAETPPARQSVNEMVAGYLAKADESYAYKVAETLGPHAVRQRLRLPLFLFK